MKSNRDDAGNQDALLATHCGLDDIGCVMSWSHAAVMSVVLCLSAVHEAQPCGWWSSHVAHRSAMWLMVACCSDVSCVVSECSS